MADKISGIAVLDRHCFPQQLLCLCLKEGRPPTLANIPVHPKGAKKHGEPEWEYLLDDGNQIHVTPSVRIMTTDGKGDPIERFHNDGSWSVQVAIATPDESDQYAYRLFRELNPSWKPSYED